MSSTNERQTDHMSDDAEGQELNTKKDMDMTLEGVNSNVSTVLDTNNQVVNANISITGLESSGLNDLTTNQ